MLSTVFMCVPSYCSTEPCSSTAPLTIDASHEGKVYLSCVCVCVLCVRVPGVLVKYSKIDLTPKAFSASQTGREKDLFLVLLLSLTPYLPVSLLFSFSLHFVSPNFPVHPSPSPSLSLGPHLLFLSFLASFCLPLFLRLFISCLIPLLRPVLPVPASLHYMHLFHTAGRSCCPLFSSEICGNRDDSSPPLALFLCFSLSL